jgi:hypothetical protein
MKPIAYIKSDIARRTAIIGLAPIVFIVAIVCGGFLGAKEWSEDAWSSARSAWHGKL